MAEIPIRRKEGRNVWPLLLGLIVLAAVLWFVVARRTRTERGGSPRRLRRSGEQQRDEGQRWRDYGQGGLLQKKADTRSGSRDYNYE